MTNDSWLSGCGTAWYASARCREASDDASPSMACSTKLSKRTNQPTRRQSDKPTNQPTNRQRRAHASQVRPTQPHYASCNVTNHTLENPAAWIVSTVWIFIHVRHIFKPFARIWIDIWKLKLRSHSWSYKQCYEKGVTAFKKHFY